jgi:hypothetical protein
MVAPDEIRGIGIQQIPPTLIGSNIQPRWGCDC